MKPLSTSLWFAGAVVALVGGVYLLAIRPAAQKREFLERDMAEKRVAVDNFERSMAASRTIARKIDALRPRIALFDSRLDGGRQSNGVLADIWRIADASALQTRSVKTPPALRSDAFSEQNIELSMSGGFGDYYQFLLQVEAMQRIARIRRMTLSKAATNEGQVQADLTLSVFSAAN